MDNVTMIVYHHTSALDARPTAYEIAAYQTGPTAHVPFPSIAYHVVIDPDGTINVCHDLEAVTWGQGAGSPETIEGIGSNNWRGWAICFSGAEPTGRQVEAMGDVADALDTLIGCRLERTVHRIVSRGKTACPGETYLRWLDEIRGGV